jgi:hypothetical protein
MIYKVKAMVIDETIGKFYRKLAHETIAKDRGRKTRRVVTKLAAPRGRSMLRTTLVIGAIVAAVAASLSGCAPYGGYAYDYGYGGAPVYGGWYGGSSPDYADNWWPRYGGVYYTGGYSYPGYIWRGGYYPYHRAVYWRGAFYRGGYYRGGDFGHRRAVYGPGWR